MRKMPESSCSKTESRENIPFMDQLRRYQSAGVEITLKDARLPLEDIAKICSIRETGVYMCDFVADEQNRIVRINLDDVGEHENGDVWDGVRADAKEEDER